VIGPQKALAGPVGISIATVSDRAWQAMSDNPSAPRGSTVSLLDWKDHWVDSDRRTIPGTPSPLEILALEAAVDRVLAEGLQALQSRHRAAAAASRSGARALGLVPFAGDADAACVVTTLAAPTGLDARFLVQRARARRAVALSAGYGALASRVIRIDHTGQRARLTTVLQALEALGAALAATYQLPGSIREALEAAEHAWSVERAGAPLPDSSSLRRYEPIAMSDAWAVPRKH
jgi:aspartate aminotransferase-like enzyme